MHQIYHELVSNLISGKKILSGTLVQTQGSAPQLPGATAVFENENVIFGTLGGGFLEAHAQKNASLASVSGKSTSHLISFNSEMDDASGAICGGSARYILDAQPQKHLNVYKQILESLKLRKKGVVISIIKESDDGELEVEKFWLEEKQLIPMNLAEKSNLNQPVLQQIIQERKARWIELNGQPESRSKAKTAIFVEPVIPLSQLIIVGAGHIGEALCKVAASVDFEVTMIDNRDEMALSSRFPDASEIICDDLNSALQRLTISPETYVVIVTQGHRTDVEALRACIHSNAAYIGVIGSKRKTMLMRKKFLDEQWATEEEWNYIHAPVGIGIHAKTVNEIAISIIAELIKKRYGQHYSGIRKKVSCIILAAGKSSRMGTQKLVLPFGISTIIRTIAEKAMHSFSDENLLVTGSHRDEITRQLEDLTIRLVENDLYEDGMLSSVQKGINSADSKSDGFVVLLGDQPMVTSELINRLIAAFQRTEKGLIVPTFNGKRGHPVLISSMYRQEINLLNPELGLRELFTNHLAEILEIEIGNESILSDIDTPEDYTRESFKLKK